MRKIYNYILKACFVLSATTCNAQGFSNNDFIGTKWERNRNSGILSYEFTNDSILFTSYDSYSPDTIKYTKPYYLSNIKTESFDSTKVGTKTFGKFLLTYNDVLRCTEYREIIDLTSDSLVLFCEAKKYNIGAANVYRTYRRIK